MTFSGTLYPFQKEAVERMIEGQCLLVAFEMGLGKTVLSIAAVERLIEDEVVSAGFVICPNSLKHQWRRQIAKFTEDQAAVIVVDGSPTRRRKLYNEYADGGADYLILNYDQVVNDWEIISMLGRDFIIADEATAFKNFKPKRSRRIKKLQATYQWALTGQPIENRAEEVFSIMQWVDSEVLGDFKEFEAAFIDRDNWGKVRRYKNLPTLHKILSGAMVRATREEVADQMPDVIEESVLVDFPPNSAKLYRIITEELLDELDAAISMFGAKAFDLTKFYSGADESSSKEAQGRIMSKMVCMRMLCDCPELLRISAEHFAGERHVGQRSGSAYAYDLRERGLLDRVNGDPKLYATLELIDELLEAAPVNKVVFFSYFTDMIDILAKSCKYKSVKFTGKMSTKQRDEAKQQFTDDPDTRLFLSSDAGGYGVDLPMANFLISYDLPWSAGAWDQRNSRIIRLSTEFPEVTLISMLISGSLEERQYDMLQQKARIGSAIVDGKGIDKRGELTLDLKSLSEFLRTSSV